MEKPLLLIFGVLIACLLCEGILRAVGAAPEVAYVEKWRLRLSENPKIGYEMIPNLDARGKSVQFFGYVGRSNSMGFRDYEHSLENEDQRTRIIVLGDSLSAGLWLAKDEEVFPAQLETLLNQDGEQFEVFNFGVLGYNTLQEVETLREKGLQFRPDVVVLQYCLNDRRQDDGGGYYHLLLEAKKKGTVAHEKIHPVLATSALYRFFRFRVLAEFGMAPTSSIADRSADFFAKDTVHESLQDLRSLADQHGFKVLVVLFPEFTAIDANKPEYEFFEEHQTIASWATELGFEYLDLLEPMRRCKAENPQELIAFDLYHPRASGYRCAAEETKRVIRQMLND